MSSHRPFFAEQIPKSLLDRLGLNKHNPTGLKHKHNPLRQVIERIS